MENQLAKTYNDLAQKINSMIPVEWKKAYYLGEVEKGRLSCSSIFYFIDSEDNIVRSHDIPDKYSVSWQIYDELLLELTNILLEMYDCFVENEQDVWEQVSFTLENSGKFNVDFKYDVMKEDDGGQSRREIIWAYNNFGYIPKEGTYYWKLLNKYLESK